MGSEGIYKCRKCGNEFTARCGGGFHFKEYRCVECDGVKPLPREPLTEKALGICDLCGGQLKDDIGPMCPACRSRDVEEKQCLILYD
jgi:hypothetical protein